MALAAQLSRLASISVIGHKKVGDHVEYEVLATTEDFATEHRSWHRYTSFALLHKELSRQKFWSQPHAFPVAKARFPDVPKRAEELGSYLQQVCLELRAVHHHDAQTPPELLIQFLLGGMESDESVDENGWGSGSPEDAIARTARSISRISFPCESAEKSGKYVSGVLGADGMLYVIPSNAPGVLQFDIRRHHTHAPPSVPPPATSSSRRLAVADLGSGGIEGSFKWLDAILAANGSIYCIPFNAPRVLRIDTSASPPIVSAIGPELLGECKWHG